MTRRVTIQNSTGRRAPRRAAVVLVNEIVALPDGSRAKVKAISNDGRHCLVVCKDNVSGGIYPLEAVRRIDSWWNRG